MAVISRGGALRHRIAIHEETDTPDGFGGFTRAWAAKSGMTSVPASIMPLTAREVIELGKSELQMSHKIKIRYRSGITAKDRVVFGSRTFNIRSIINTEERNIELLFLVEELT